MILECDTIKMMFGSVIAVNNLSFHVEKGEIFGIAGPNGSGKTTVFNLISGIYKGSGKILFNGKEIQNIPTHERCHLGIARTLQTPKLFKSLNVRQNVAISGNFGKPGGASIDPIVDDTLEFVGVSRHSSTAVSALNLIDQKLTMIACCLATQPELLLLDEPMAGLSMNEIEQTTLLIKKINSERKITIIIIEHFMKVLADLSKRLMIIESGTLICNDCPANVLKNKKVIECYLGEEH